jgi:hypothetical protein
MPNENASEAMDLITSSVDKFVGNHEVRAVLISNFLFENSGDARLLSLIGFLHPRIYFALSSSPHRA